MDNVTNDLGRRLAAWPAQPRTIGATLLHAAAAWPERDALVMDGRRATYAGLFDETLVCARGLIGLGVARGDHVGVLMPNCWDYLVLFHAITLIGANATLLNARYGADELRYVLDQADVRVLFIGGHAFPYMDFRTTLLGLYPELAGWDGRERLNLAGAPRLERIVELSDPRPGVWPDAKAFAAMADGVADARVCDAAAAVAENDVCLMMFSSGTTSSPKACMLSHRNLCQTGALVAERFQLTATDKIYDPTPLFHMSTILPMAACRAAGAAFIGTKRFDAAEALETIEAERATVAYTSFPAIMTALLDHPTFATRDLSAIRLVNNVGPPELLRRYHAALPGAIHISGYGLTEAGGVVCFNELTDTPDQRVTTGGRPLPGSEARIIDPASGQEVPRGERGEIQLRGVCLFDGYYKAPARNAEVMTRDGWLRTGDIGALDEDGRVRYLGRIKDMLKIGGENVAALEIESFLNSHPAVQVVSVVGVPDERLIEVAAAFVELRPGAETTAEDLVRYCIGRIASFKIPRYIRFVETWPMSATKVQKFRLLDGFEPVGKIEPRQLAGSGT